MSQKEEQAPEDTKPLAGVAREALEAPSGPVGSVRLNRIRHYLRKTGIQNQFQNLLHLLLSRDELPYNPYPGFAVRLRPFMEKFYTDIETDEKIEYLLTVPLRETQLIDLFTVQDGGPVWGLRSILRVLNPTMVNRYRWLSDNITPSFNDLYQKEGYSAVSIFVNSVILDIDRLGDSNHHILIGLNVPVQTENVWLLEFWDPETIQKHKGELMQKICDAVIESKYIIAECVFRLDPLTDTYIQGQKQYTLSFVAVNNELKEEGLSNFAEFPMASLHEGLFLNQTHAESYISMFTSQLDMLELSNIRRTSARPAVGQPGLAARQYSAVAEDDYHYIHRHVHQRLQQHKPRKAQIDGFRLRDDPGSGAFSWQITSPIKSNLQKRIVAFDPWAQLFDIVYHLILLILMERKTTDMPLLIELYKLCHGTAGKLHMLGEKNKAVRALIRGFMNRSDTQRVRKFLLEYKHEIDELLAASLHERSSDLKAVGRRMSAEVSQLLEVTDEELGLASHLNMIVITLRDQQSFMTTTLMRLSEDALFWCPNVKKQIEDLHISFPEAIPRPGSHTRDPEIAGPRDRIPKETFMRHGFEDEHIMRHENTTIVVSKCMERDTSPKVIAKESVLMKYMLDTHLDEMWEQFLEETFEKTHLPPNPYPSFISRCRTSTMKMDLCYESESVILERMLTKTAQLVDSDNFVYQLPNCDGCGAATAIALLDPGGYVPLLQCVQDNLINKAYLHRKGPYRIGLCLGVTGPAALYGKMQPYLTQLDLHEHYYIQGPVGCQTDAAQLFAVMVQKHIFELVTDNKVPILGVFIGKDRIRWSWEEIINKKLGFFSEVETAVLQKEQIYLKAYVLMDGWRYVPVIKLFLLHYIREDEISTETFFQDDPVYFYTTVFSSPERAAFHYQNGGPLRGGNPLSSSNILAAVTALDKQLLLLREKSEFMEVHRLLLYRSLISDDTDHIVDAWRMFHSIAGQAEYAATLAQSIAELVEFEIEFSKFLPIEPSQTGSSVQTVSPLNLGILSSMTKALIEKAQIVSEWRVSMCVTTMPDFIQKKIKSVTETDRRTNCIYPIIQENTVVVMEEISQMFVNIRTTSSSDVHHMSDNAITTFQEIEKADGHRPLSVESQLLNDPQVFLQRPRAGHKVLEDDLLYRPKKQQMYKPVVKF
ncbi:uncharacterized protein LOC131936245 isoform X2 [Physella acuta]|uniref:uncharacterized protein LOC131936245 isoform X2 n=1 Tax=Physella acuta TaxID=109671 RepID=UPI0027DB092D|nr:uncharacterized protein LOC131936245 isoform X2 [Physella acuta]